MSSLVSAPERSVGGKITRSGLDTRSSRPPASTIVASAFAMPLSCTATAPGAHGPGCLVVVAVAPGKPRHGERQLARVEVGVDDQIEAVSPVDGRRPPEQVARLGAFERGAPGAVAQLDERQLS